MNNLGHILILVPYPSDNWWIICAKAATTGTVCNWRVTNISSHRSANLHSVWQELALLRVYWVNQIRVTCRTYSTYVPAVTGLYTSDLEVYDWERWKPEGWKNFQFNLKKFLTNSQNCVGNPKRYTFKKWKKRNRQVKCTVRQEDQ